MATIEYEHLRALGWTEQRAAQFESYLTSDSRPARVIAIHRGAYVVHDGLNERRATLSGRLRHRSAVGDFPSVGDWVVIAGASNAKSSALIEWVAPRTSALIRAEPHRNARPQVLATNVDVVLLAAALPHGVNVRRLERAVTLTWESGAIPIVLLTKADLCDDVPGAVAEVRARLTGVDVLAVSALADVGLEMSPALLHPAQTGVLLGPSGVGKSTLLNALLGHEQMRTAAVRSDGKGRHTTTHRELFRLPNGAFVIDTPGLRELQLWGDETSVGTTFDDVRELAQSCRFGDCAHESEPGCAVLDAVEQGRLPVDRLAHWHQLRAELAYLKRRDDARATSESKRRDAAAARAGRARIIEKRGQTR